MKIQWTEVFNSIIIFFSICTQLFIQLTMFYFIGQSGDSVSTSVLGFSSSWLNITSNFPLVGSSYYILAAAGHEYGKKNYDIVFSFIYKSTVINLILGAVLCFLNQFCQYYFTFFHFESDIIDESVYFVRFGALNVFPFAPLIASNIFFTSILRLKEVAIVTALTLIISPFVCWIFMIKLDYGIYAAPWIIIFITTFELVVFALLIIFSKDSVIILVRRPPNKNTFNFFWKTLGMSLITSAMSSIEFTGAEINIILATYLGSAESSAFCVLYEIEVMGSIFGYSISTAVTQQLAESIGAQQHETFRSLILKAYYISLIACAICTIAFVSMKFFVGKLIYSSDPSVEILVNENFFYFVAVVLFDIMQLNLANVAKSIGWFEKSLVVSIISFYFTGLPITILLLIVFKMGLLSLIIGFSCSLIMCNICYIILLMFFFDENKEFDRVKGEFQKEEEKSIEKNENLLEKKEILIEKKEN